MLPFPEHLFIRLQYDPEAAALVNLTHDTTNLIAAAGLVVNLMLDNRVQLDKTQLLILDPQPTGSALLDEAVARLASVGSIDHNDPNWFQKIVDALPLGASLESAITQKGLINRQEKKAMFGLSKTVTYPFNDPSVPVSLFEGERAIMLHGARPDPKTAAIIFMASCWGASRPWKLSRQENKQYDDRYKAIYGDYWGWYDKDEPVEYIEGMTPDLRYAIADLAISWATIYMT
ncbi:MAG: GPP34 family phosphoprotein [Candidatus Promineifilaceae bacterium]